MNRNTTTAAVNDRNREPRAQRMDDERLQTLRKYDVIKAWSTRDVRAYTFQQTKQPMTSLELNILFNRWVLSDVKASCVEA